MAVVEKNLSAAWLQEENVTLEPVDDAIRVVQVYTSRKALSSMYFTDSACVLTRHTKSSL